MDPSLTIMDQIDTWDNVSAAALKVWALENTQTRDQIFQFVQHRSESRKFPCDTVNSPTFTGACSFPFKFYDCALVDPTNPEISGNCESFDPQEMKTVNSCTLSEDTKPWCAVHVYENKSMVIGSAMMYSYEYLLYQKQIKSLTIIYLQQCLGPDSAKICRFMYTIQGSKYQPKTVKINYLILKPKSEQLNK